MPYTLNQIQSAIDALSPDLEALGQNTEATAALQATARQKAATASAMAFLAGIGQRVFAAMAAERLPKSPRRGVNISESWRVLLNHPHRGEIAAQWAEGNFATPIASALRSLRSIPDPLLGVRRAIARALKAGQSADAIIAAAEDVLVHPAGAEEGEEEPEHAEAAA